MTDSEYKGIYGMTKEEYLKMYFNEINYNSLTAVCSKNKSAAGQYPELEIGKTYDVSHIGVFRSMTRLRLRSQGDKEYNSVCFDIYENGEPLDYSIVKDPRFWAPYLRESYRERNPFYLEGQMEHVAIPAHLKEIEQRYDVKILLAVEWGSRAWGFDSKDSDWDVRFVYVHKPGWYFKIREQPKDIDYACADGVDMFGWELREVLSMLSQGIPQLLEWLHSPKVYYIDEGFAKRIHTIEEHIFKPGWAMEHYFEMYSHQNERFIQQADCPIKYFLYYLRGILACNWIEKKRTLPPVPFKELMVAILENDEIREKVEDLIQKKKESKTSDMFTIDNALLKYARSMADYYNKNIAFLCSGPHGIDVKSLDSLYYDMVQTNNSLNDHTTII